jgi:excisionase family DNA binding protein
MDSGLLTPMDVARILRVGAPTLKQWREEGTGPAWIELEGQTVRYRREDVDRFIERRARQHKGV